MPRPARLGAHLQPVRMGPFPHDAVEVPEYERIALGRLHRRRHPSLPAHGIDVRERAANRFGHAPYDRPQKALKVIGHGCGVCYVHLVELAVGKAAKRPAGRRRVHLELEPKSGALPYRKRDTVEPLFRHHLELDRGHSVLVAVAPVVEHEDTAEPEPLNRFQVACHVFLVYISILPQPVRPRTALARRTGERRRVQPRIAPAVGQRNRSRAGRNRQEHRLTQHSYFSSVTTTVSMPRARPSFFSSAA